MGNANTQDFLECFEEFGLKFNNKSCLNVIMKICDQRSRSFFDLYPRTLIV